jgi:hypothetical protein
LSKAQGLLVGFHVRQQPAKLGSLLGSHAAVLIQVDRFLGHDFGAFVQTVDVVAAVSSSSTLRNMPTKFRRRILHNENGRAGAVVHAETDTFALETAAA